MKYDKFTCLNNIYKLIKYKNLKMGDVETNVGVSTGYFSKLSKKNNKTSPSIEVLCKIADLFNISLDKLCKTDLSAMNDSDLYIFLFISLLLKKTNEGVYIWTCEDENELNDKYIKKIECKSKKLFDFEEVPYKGETDYPDYYERVIYKSAFRKGELLEANGDSYYLDLPNGSTVFLMMIRRIDNGMNKELDKDVDIEMYIQNNDDISPIDRFQTKEDSDADNVIYDLYCSAKQSSKHRLLNKKAKDSIDSYMKLEGD